MDRSEYNFKNLETKYGGFLAPSFVVTIGSVKIDSSRVPVSSLSVDIELSTAGGCRFVIESLYDYENRKWANDLLDTIEVGKVIIIEAGYLRREEVFYGFVDDFSIEYSANAAPRLLVSGIDAKGYLMNIKGQRFMSEKSTREVVRRIFNECIQHKYAKTSTVGNITDYGAQLIKPEVNYYKFLSHIAEIHRMQFFVVDGELIFDDLLGFTRPVLTLTLGVSLLSFSKTVSLKKQIGKFEVHGIHPETKKAINGEADSTSIASTTGSEASKLAPGFDSIVEKENSPFVSTPEECNQLAQARFDSIAINFVICKGQCIGIPEIIPGRYIRVQNIDRRTNNIFFITKVTHDYSSEQGYFTSFEAKGAKS